jgi:apolipoprotein N-acyltransferase
MKLWFRGGLALALGALFILGLAPFAVWPAIPLSIGGFYALLRSTDNTPKSSFAIGWCYGLGFFGVGASWVYVSINVYGGASAVLAALLTVLFCGGLALLPGGQALVFQRWFNRRATTSTATIQSACAFAALWVLFEWLRSWLLTGFPWLYAGYAALDSPYAGWAPLGGVWLTSFLLALSGTLLAALGRVTSHTTLSAGLTSRVKQRSTWIIVLVLLGIPASGEYLKRVAWTDTQGAPLRSALVQPNIPLEKKWDRRFLPSILNHYQQVSAPLYSQVDLVLWPESAIPLYAHRAQDFLATQGARARRGQSALITGIPTKEGEHAYNSIIALGTGEGTYHKQKLVPFGEYVPLERWLRGLIAFFDLPMSQFSVGPTAQPLLTMTTPAGQVLSIASYICYEVVYPDFAATIAKDAAFLITVSNDSWFGDSIGPLQHAQMARFRALETQRDMLRGTNNGVTAIINHRGEVTAALPQFTEDVLLGTIQPRSGQTPFMRWGATPTLLLAAVLLAINWLGRRR